MTGMQRNTPSFDLLEWTGPSTRADFVAAADTRRVPAGRLIYQQGEPGDEMFRIVEGRVRLSVSRGDGKEIIFLFFETGDCFGVSSLIDGEPRPQTAEAVSATVLQVVDERRFSRLRAAHGDFERALLKLLTLQMRVVSAHFVEASLADLGSRVALRLIECALRDEAAQEQVRMPQNELAALVGASRQSVNRILQQLQARNLISIEYNTIRILDREGLRAFVFEGRGT